MDGPCEFQIIFKRAHTFTQNDLSVQNLVIDTTAPTASVTQRSRTVVSMTMGVTLFDDG